MRTTPHVVLALVAVGVAVVGLNSQGRSGAPGQARLTHIPRSTVKVEQLIGGAYAPYVVERWTRRRDAELTIYYVLSTWNPYVVVLMKSAFQISGG